MSTRRHVLKLLAAAPVAFAGPFAPARAAPERRLDARAFGLVPGAAHDQGAAFAAAVATAARRGAVLHLPPGVIRLRDVRLSGPVRLAGEGARLSAAPGAAFALRIEGGPAHLSGISFHGGDISPGAAEETGGLVSIHDCADVRITACRFSGGAGNGLYLRHCSGLVRGNAFSGHGAAALFSHGGVNMRLEENRIHDIGNNGILVWQDEKRFDGSVVARNVVRRIRADAGGDGPNGNGINIFRAGGVQVLGNVIASCAYSAVRNNSSDHCRIKGNDCSDLGEVAIFVEFAFRDARVIANRIRCASAGICVTNADHGGRGAVVRGNVIRDIAPRIASPDVLGYGIWVEADTLIEENLVEDARTGLWLGWGPWLDGVRAIANTLRRCDVGIAVSVTPGAGRAEIRGNLVERAARAAIMGYDHARAMTGDLLRPGASVPERLVMAANRVI